MRAALIALLLSTPLCARQDEETRRRQRELERIQELERQEFFGEPSDEFYIDYGAWIRAGWFAFEDGSGHGISREDYDIRAWLDVRYKAHELYLRVSANYWEYAHNDGPEGDDHELEGPRGDVIFYQIQLGEALGGPERSWDLVARAGRQYVRLGSGLVYNNIADGLSIRGNVGPVAFELFGLRSQPHEDDIDRSRPNNDSQERYFIGGKVSVTAIQDHTPWLAFMVERDRQDESPDILNQDFEFDAEYYGAGIRGRLFAEGLYYEIEGWIQRGERFAHLRTTPEDVKAYALLLSLEYDFAVVTHPRLKASFLWGSGDEDRFRITTTVLGNTPGTDDEAFLGFGYIPTGSALAPYLSNLRIFRIGGAVRPLEMLDVWDLQWDQLEFGFDFFWYRKDEKTGGISDPFAGFDDSDIGHEIDGTVTWSILSDVSLTARFGVFYPGSAYLNDDKRPFVSVGILFSF